MSSNTTSIRLSRQTLKKLRAFKVHPRETYEDIILRLIKHTKEIMKGGKE